MPRLAEGREELECFRNALKHWDGNGWVFLEKDASSGINNYLENWTESAFLESLHDFVVLNHGRVDQQNETRQEYRDQGWDYYYKVMLMIEGTSYFVETRLKYKDPADPDDPIIFIVNFHP